jgi:Type III secretion protein YscO
MLREKGLSMEDKITALEKDIEKGRSLVEQARVKAVAAEKEYEKIVEHRQVWQGEMHLQQERLAEKELEEFLTRRQERRDQ